MFKLFLQVFAVATGWRGGKQFPVAKFIVPDWGE
jgi:hypothetical protein